MRYTAAVKDGYGGHRTVTSVIAETAHEANGRVRHELAKPGRQGYLQRWLEDGEILLDENGEIAVDEELEGVRYYVDYIVASNPHLNRMEEMSAREVMEFLPALATYKEALERKDILFSLDIMIGEEQYRITPVEA